MERHYQGGTITLYSTASWITRVGVIYSQAKAPRHRHRSRDWEGSMDGSKLTELLDRWAARRSADLTWWWFDCSNTSSSASCNASLLLDWTWWLLSTVEVDDDSLGRGNGLFVLLSCGGVSTRSRSRVLMRRERDVRSNKPDICEEIWMSSSPCCVRENEEWVNCKNSQTMTMFQGNDVLIDEHHIVKTGSFWLIPSTRYGSWIVKLHIYW